MFKRLLFLCMALSVAGICTTPLEQYPKYKVYASPNVSAQEFYDKLLQYADKENWRKVLSYCDAILSNYEDSVFAADATFYKGLAQYKRKEWAKANATFSSYLCNFQNIQHFETALRCKYEIAKIFEGGVRKHLFGAKYTPKWLSAKQDALDIYEEVVTALPRDEIAADSLFRKAKLLSELREFKESIEVYQTLIRRFPKHPLAPESYLNITKVYYEQSIYLFLDPDFVALAQQNLSRFRLAFPGDDRIKSAENVLVKMKEKFAEDLEEIGHYFEARKQFGAARIYYKALAKRYPDTHIANKVYPKIEKMEKLAQAKEAKKNKKVK